MKLSYYRMHNESDEEMTHRIRYSAKQLGMLIFNVGTNRLDDTRRGITLTTQTTPNGTQYTYTDERR